MKATAVANANIALVKYWGKRDSSLILPHNGSISMTCQGLLTRTTVEFGQFDQDEITINNQELKKDAKGVLSHIEKIRHLAGIREKAKVVSETNFPVAAGLASSASGLAALTVAAANAAGMQLQERELTILARQGSGSASRSISEGFVEWKRGQREDGQDSYGESIAGQDHWPEFRILACIVSEEKKAVSSRAGMSQTVATCPYYPAWVESATKDLDVVRQAIKDRDFKTVGETAELSSLKMHATMMTTSPPIIYWTPATVQIMHAIMGWREELPSYFTMDAGPQVKVMCLAEHQAELEKRLHDLGVVQKIIPCTPGEGAKLVEQHLF